VRAGWVFHDGHDCVHVSNTSAQCREIARLLERRRVEQGEWQAHEAAAVADTRTRLQAHIAELNGEVAKARGDVAAATAAAERALRDARAAQAETDRVSASARTQLTGLEATVRDLNERCRAALEERDATDRKVSGMVGYQPPPPLVHPWHTFASCHRTARACAGPRGGGGVRGCGAGRAAQPP